MTDTIKGGAYKTSDDKWVDANGKPIAAPKELPVDPKLKEFESLTAQQITPGAPLTQSQLAGAEARASVVAPALSGEEYEAPADEIEDKASDKPKARKYSKK